MDDGFKNAIKIIPTRIKTPLSMIDERDKMQLQEIRLRANMPLCVTIFGENRIVSSSGALCKMPDRSSVICDKNDITAAFHAACDYSVYAYQNEINNGFLTISGGNRIGLCGTAVTENGQVKSIKGISSLNIRIAHEHKFCAKSVIDHYITHGLQNTVIIGPPSSGKTTFLRDIIYQLSSGKCGKMYRVCAVDERYELCSASGGTSPFDLGSMCDVLSGYSKASGIINAVRVQNPQVIVFDEIATNDELQASAQGFAAGASIITSVHSNGIDDFFKRDVCRNLVSCNIFDCFVFLGEKAGDPVKIMNLEEMKNEAVRHSFTKPYSDNNRLYESQKQRFGG